jgi:transcriptional regulator with XRE-family HTH domain
VPADLAAILASNIRAQRAKRKWRQQDLADRIEGVSMATVSDMETGARNMLVNDLLPLCEAFGLPLVKLLDGARDEDLRTLGLL